MDILRRTNYRGHRTLNQRQSPDKIKQEHGSSPPLLFGLASQGSVTAVVAQS
jgi:hypothetical protein